MSESLTLSLLRGLLGLLAAYHLGIGLASTLSFGATAQITRRLYALELSESAQFAYAVRMLGLYALVFGGLLAMAAWRPIEHRAVIVAVVALLLLRAVTRLTNGAMLERVFHVRGRGTPHTWRCW